MPKTKQKTVAAAKKPKSVAAAAKKTKHKPKPIRKAVITNTKRVQRSLVGTEF